MLPTFVALTSTRNVFFAALAAAIRRRWLHVHGQMQAIMAAKVLASGTSLSLSSLTRVGARQINVERNLRAKKLNKAKTKVDMAEKALKNFDKRQSRAALKQGGGGGDGSGSGLAAKLLGGS